MATLWITEYNTITQDPNGPIQVPIQPCGRTQDIPIPGTSDALASTTKLVRLWTDTACLISFGGADAFPMGAGGTEYQGVLPNSNIEIDVIANP